MSTVSTYDNMLLEHRPKKPKKKSKIQGAKFSPWTKIGTGDKNGK